LISPRTLAFAVRLITVVVLAVLAALLVARYAMATPSRTLTLHCTHYTPPYSVDNEWACGDTHPVSATSYNTTSVAVRNDNAAAASPSQHMCVWYYTTDQGIGQYDTTCATGAGVNIGDTSYFYAYSYCSFGSSSNAGVCATTWYD
jgi:hypothetical protein